LDWLFPILKPDAKAPGSSAISILTQLLHVRGSKSRHVPQRGFGHFHPFLRSKFVDALGVLERYKERSMIQACE
jgi:hypothetical protein